MKLIKPITIKNLRLKNNIFLAPLAAVNCPAYMDLCLDYGAGLVYTQMIDVETIDYKSFKNRFLPQKGPIAVQLLGSDTYALKKGVEFVDKFADIIDFNFGCCIKEVLAKKSGAFLLKHPEQIKKKFADVFQATHKPITAKIRSGWDKDSINAVEVSKILEDMGISAIAVHPRTRKDVYSTKADWKIISEVKRNVSIPVIGNGDILDFSAAQRMLRSTRCDAIMLGRGVIGNPTLFKEIIEEKELPKNRKKIFFDFLELYNRQSRQNFSELKQHCSWIFKNHKNSRDIKKLISKTKTKEELIKLIKTL
jgi:tRNA-dihydrouridine synthase B